jgi:predicted PurR-regulated permease PerM
MDQKSNSKATIIFLVVLLVALLLLAGYIAGPFIEPIAMAVIVAVAFYPLYQWIYRHLKKPGRAALLTILILLLVVGIPLSLILIAASGQALSAAHYVSQKSAEQGGIISLIMAILQKPLAFVGRHADLSDFDLRSQIISHLQQISVELLSMSASVLGNIVGLFAKALLALFTAFFLFRDGDRVVDRMLHLMPLSRERGRRLLSAIRDAIVGNFYALAAVGGAQGFLTAIGLQIAGIHSAVLLGLAASFCSLIPIVGPALIWGPAAGYLFFVGRTWAAVFLLLWGILAIGTVDNIIRPLVVGGKVQMHPLLLLFAILGGAQAFGLLGIFLGPVLLSLISAVMLTLSEISDETSKPVAPETADT